MNLNRQQTEIIQILKSLPTQGMNSYEWRMKYIQLPARIKELKRMGYEIISRQNPNRSVNYILLKEPTIKKVETVNISHDVKPVQEALF